MKLISARGECQRCSDKWTAKNAQALAAQHESRTGHAVEVTLIYRSDHQRTKRQSDAGLPFEEKR